ncbi:MAG: hypothetical protein FWE95_09520 [Planctomycetaceae bacterium]|nr:hypothetical protein [Planctomycetaceae bacterium]
MFAALLGNINPIDVPMEMEMSFASSGVTAVPAFGLLFVVMLVLGFMVLGIVAVVGILIFCLRGKQGKELKQTIADQQTQIEDLKRELAEIKPKLNQ